MYSPGLLPCVLWWASVLSPVSATASSPTSQGGFFPEGETGMSVLETFQAPVETADSVLEFLSVKDLPKIEAAIGASKALGGDVQLLHLGEDCVARLRAGVALEAAIAQLQHKRCVAVAVGGVGQA